MSHRNPFGILRRSGTVSSPAQTQDKLSPLVHLFVTVIVFVICASQTGDESRWTSVLLALPVVAQVTGSVILYYRVNRNRRRGNIDYYRWNLRFTTACVIFYCVLWIVYSEKWFATHPNWLQAISILAVVFIAVLLGFVGLMTAAIIMASAEDQSTNWLIDQCKALKAGIRVEPLWAIALFFVLFLGVAYLFGFALAFHDKGSIAGTKLPSLHMINLKSPDDGPTAPATEAEGKGNETIEALTDQSDKSVFSQADANTLTMGQQEEFCFYFEEAKATLNLSKEDCTSGNPSRSGTNPTKPQLFNSCSLKALEARLRLMMGTGGRVRVTLLGHSDNEPLRSKSINSPRYLSNYELSESRAQNVQYEILQKLREKSFQRIDNVDWVVFPAGDEALPQINRGAIREEMFLAEELENMGVSRGSDRKFFVDQIEKYLPAESIDQKLPAQEKRVVIALLEPISENPVVLNRAQINDLTSDQRKTLDEIKSLKNAENQYIAQSKSKDMRLMDYMYFSLYTITTTGYGDIVPTTAYAKFVTSLANICEVLFLVVFFNALISIRSNGPDSEKENTNENDHLDDSDEDSTGVRGRTA